MKGLARVNGIIKERIRDSINIKEALLEDESLLNAVENAANEIAKAIGNENKIVICGNGGSASDALHFAGEIVGRYQKERNPWSAIALNADAATMTAIANDYGYDEVFARQAQGHVKQGDVFVGISTSGNSENVLKACRIAEEQGAVTIALLGRDGGKINGVADYPIIIPCNITARIQECHILLIHIICEIVEEKLT